METIPIPASTPTRGRSSFLTVICILTFLGSGWGVIKCIRQYATANTISTIASEVIERRESLINEENAPSFVKRIIASVNENIGPESIRTYSIIGLFSNLLKLVGAILMWKLRKAGFYLYLAGVLVIVGSPLMMGQLIGIISGFIRGFIGVIFIVMFAVNLKYMNKSGSGSIPNQI